MREIKFKLWCRGTAEYNVNFQKSGWWGLSDYLIQKYYTFESLFESKDFVCCQFTGLYDKSGKEIYEGDILVYHPSYEESEGGQFPDMISVARFEDGSFTIGRDEDPIWRKDMGQDYAGLYEIIGNIFENPELL